MKGMINLFGLEIRLKQEASLNPSSPMLRDVLRDLKRRDHGPLEKFINDDLLPIEGSVILVNGRNILSLDGWETIIQDGDEITFLAPVAGG
jgi:molybdopterin converting factor small subunit